LWECVRLKNVVLDGDSIIISNFLREERIHLSQICEVNELTLLAGHPTLVRFSAPTTFGTQILFLPKGMRWLGKSSAAAERLRVLSSSSRVAKEIDDLEAG
jgi:hypothetical protein